ncbi:hypothetical protein INT47_004143, partial [Mucor saturninus]
MDLQINVITAWKAAGVDLRTNCLREYLQLFLCQLKRVKNSALLAVYHLRYDQFFEGEPLKPADVPEVAKEFPLPARKKRRR